jgi:transcriptional regulator with XRE-family HTH domain
MQPLLVPRHQRKFITDDTITVRKVRELRGYSRTQAGLLLDVSSKQIEAIENGRVQLTDERIAHICAAYNLSTTRYADIKAGKITTRDHSDMSPRPKIIEHKKLRRSYRKVVDGKVRAIISLRHLAGLTQYEATFRCGYAKCQFGQIENGRVELSEKRIRHIVACLGFTSDDFQREARAGEKTTYELRSECLASINVLGIEQLRSVSSLLQTLRSAVVSGS